MYRTIVVIAAALLLAACSGKQPGEADIRQQFELTELPGLVELKSFALEQRRNTGSDEHPIWLARYTAQIALREDTYEIDNVEGDTRLLKPVRRAGEAFGVYGLVRSERAGEDWRHSFQRDGSSNPVLGRPRGDYGPDALVAGSPEATTLLAEIERQRDQERIAAETTRAAEETERKRIEQAEVAWRQRIEEAVAKHQAEFAPDHLRAVARREHEGKTFNFLIENLDPHGTEGLIGTDIYTADSSLRKAVAHAGVLKTGESGIVAATIVKSPDRFVGSPRNGLDSRSSTLAAACCYQAYSVRLIEKLAEPATQGQ